MQMRCLGEEVNTIEIIETFIKGKASPSLCEDAYVISKDFVAVIDGITSKSDFSYQGKTTGKLAAQIIQNVLETLPRQAEIEEFIAQVNQRIQQFYQQVPFPYSIEEKGLQAVCAVYSDHHRQIWLIGDCKVQVDGQNYENPKKSDQILAAMRSLAIHVLERDPVNQKVQTQARSLIEPWILKATTFANDATTEYGYSVVNGQPIPQQLILKLDLDENPHEVILASDGYPTVEGTLQRSEEELEKLMKIDPGCCGPHKETKGLVQGNLSFDDRTYIRFTIEEAKKPS